MQGLIRRIEVLEKYVDRHSTYEEILFTVLDELSMASNSQPVADQRL